MEPGGDMYLPACKAFADAMLDRILHEGLNDKSGYANPPQLPGNIDKYAQAVLKPRALDIQICLDQIEFFSNRDEFFSGAEDSTQQAGQPHERSERAFRRRLDQITERREGTG